MKNVIINFNHIRDMFRMTAQLYGVTTQKLNRVWSMGYQSDRDEDLLHMLHRLAESLRVIKEASVENDLLTVCCALIRAGSEAHSLSNFFDAVKDDMSRIHGLEADLDWYAVPADYQVLPCYQYNPIEDASAFSAGFNLIYGAKRNEEGTKKGAYKLVVDLNQIKNTLMHFAKTHGLTDKDLKHITKEGVIEFRLSFWEDLNESFVRNIINLQEMMRIFEKAFQKKDTLTATWVLKHAPKVAETLIRLFWAIKKDLNQTSSDKYFKWPPLPDRFVYPARYRYEKLR